MRRAGLGTGQTVKHLELVSNFCLCFQLRTNQREPAKHPERGTQDAPLLGDHLQPPRAHGQGKRGSFPLPPRRLFRLLPAFECLPENSGDGGWLPRTQQDPPSTHTWGFLTMGRALISERQEGLASRGLTIGQAASALSPMGRNSSAENKLHK